MSDDKQTTALARADQPVAQKRAWNGVDVVEVRIDGVRYWTLAEGAIALGMTTPGLDSILRRHPDDFASTSTILTGKRAAGVAAEVARVKYVSCAEQETSERQAGRLILLTERGMVRAWSLTDAGRIAIADDYADRLTPRILPSYSIERELIETFATATPKVQRAAREVLGLSLPDSRTDPYVRSLVAEALSADTWTSLAALVHRSGLRRDVVRLALSGLETDGLVRVRYEPKLRWQLASPARLLR